jgi:hypothetical protein
MAVAPSIEWQYPHEKVYHLCCVVFNCGITAVDKPRWAAAAMRVERMPITTGCRMPIIPRCSLSIFMVSIILSQAVMAMSFDTAFFS